MTRLKILRRTAGVTQEEFARRLLVPLNSLRMWDSGLRSAPVSVLARAEALIRDEAHQTELVSLRKLARELGINVQTLQGAIRSGRLEATFSTRSAFGRPMRLATREAGQRFMTAGYLRRKSSPLPVLFQAVPEDFDKQLRGIRQRMRLSQSALASRLGAASKAVVYQWESRKRTPSPVFWQRLLAMEIR